MQILKQGKRIINESLLDEVRQAGCCICGKRAQAAHIKTRATFADDIPSNLMSLCWVHHTEQHAMGWSRFRLRYPMIRTYAEILEER